MGLTGCNKGVYTPGTYTATAQGRGGVVSVTVTVDENNIVDVQVDGPKETPDIGGVAIEQLATAMVEANSAEVDIVSGATMSSNAVIYATRAALAEASGVPLELPALVMTPGTYTGQAQGMHGTIVVETEVSEDAIVSVKVTDAIAKTDTTVEWLPHNWMTDQNYASLNETPWIFEAAASRLPDRIVANQSLAVDVVTGATASSQGILAAVTDCVRQAGGDPYALYRPVAKSTATEEYTCDVIVVGAGTSGCTAAAKAAADGANVILVEKSGTVGGTGALSFMPMTTGSRLHDAAGIYPEVETLQDHIMAQVHYVANERILNEFLTESPDTMNFLMDHGFKLKVPVVDEAFLMAFGANKMAEDPNTYAMMFYDCAPESQAAQDQFVRMVSDVDTILYETTAKTLITDESGAVVGVTAERYDGTQITIRANSVVVCTGGFAGSEELQTKYNGDYFRVFGLTQNVGEGLTMMLDAGAAEKNIGGYVAHLFDVYAPLEGDTLTDEDKAAPYSIACSPTFLRVDDTGARFMDESQRMRSLQPAINEEYAVGPYFWTIVSGDQYEALKAEGLLGTGMDSFPMGQSINAMTIFPDYKMTNFDAIATAGEAVGTMYRADSIEELAEITGMDPAILSATIAEYNTACAAGSDPTFFKDPKYLNPLGESGPWFAIKCVPEVYSSLGGVAVNENMQVLDENGLPIPGLYAAGVEAIGAVTDGVMYPEVEGLTLGWGFTSGKIAGRSAAE